MAKKLFLGIALDTQQRQVIRQLQDSFEAGTRLVPVANLHITLAFFGLVSSKMQRKLEKRISALHKPKFSITLNKLAHWKKPKILCLTGENKDKGLQLLAKDCQAIAATVNEQHSEHVFTAHVTVARKARRLPPCCAEKSPFEPVIIQPEAIHLFESKSCSGGVEYHILRSWPLC